jgi:hypothetical protein
MLAPRHHAEIVQSWAPRRSASAALRSRQSSVARSSPRGQVSHIATKAARPDHFRDRAQRSLAAILALTVVCQTSIEPKFSPQFEFDKPPSEDSNSDVLRPARRTAWVGSGARGQPRKRKLFSWNDRRSALVQINPNIAESSKR